MKSNSQLNQVRTARKALPKAPARVEKVFSIEDAINDPRNKRIKDKLQFEYDMIENVVNGADNLEKRIRAGRRVFIFVCFPLALNFVMMIVNLATGNMFGFVQMGLVALLLFTMKLNLNSRKSLKTVLNNSNKMIDTANQNAKDMVMAERKYNSTNI